MGSVNLVRLFIWLFCAFLVERLVEGTLHILPFLDKRKILGCDVPVVIAFIYALAICFGVGFDLFGMFTIPFQWPWVGILLAAIITAQGSSGVHPVIKRWFQNQKDMKNPDATFGTSTTTLPEEPEVSTETEKALDAVKASTTAPIGGNPGN
jgi:hypothetical protein